MPVITISKIAERTKTSAKGKKYKVITVEGTKYGSEEEWSTDIFKNKTEILEALEEFGPGDVANFKFIKDGRFWELNEIVEPTEENLAYAKDNSSGGGQRREKSGKSSANNSMSKDEWAAKDAATKASIARAVAIKLANDNTKIGTKSEVLIKMAIEFLPFLMGEDEALYDALPSPEDALDPPVED